MRVIVHSAAIQDHDGAGLVLDKIRRRFPWLELVCADGGYNAWQVDAVVAKVPLLRIKIVKRRNGGRGRAVRPWRSGRPSRFSAAAAAATSPRPANQPTGPAHRAAVRAPWRRKAFGGVNTLAEPVRAMSCAKRSRARVACLAVGQAGDSRWSSSTKPAEVTKSRQVSRSKKQA